MDQRVVGVVITFGCSIYVELISSFHICSITINASARDAVHASHSPGYVAFSEEPEVLKTQPGEMEMRENRATGLLIFTCVASYRQRTNKVHVIILSCSISVQMLKPIGNRER